MSVLGLDIENATTIVVNQSTRAYLVCGLDKFTPYKIWMCAFTRVGNGPYSDVIVVKTDEDGTSLAMHDWNETSALDLHEIEY